MNIIEFLNVPEVELENLEIKKISFTEKQFMLELSTDEEARRLEHILSCTFPWIFRRKTLFGNKLVVKW